MTSSSQDSSKQNDSLLWLAAAVVVGIGLTWLVLSKPWSSGAEETPRVDVPAVAAAARRPQPSPDAQTRLETSLDQNPLRMAELAYDAGMLVEPEEYSAWALYGRVLQQEPESAAAKQGLEKIAEELLRRANSALEQGRFADARAAVERIRSAIPVHPGANDLAFRIEELAPRPVPEPAQVRAEPESADGEDGQEAAAPTVAEQVAVEAAPEPEVDPAIAPYEAFVSALAQNRLLTPVGSSAKYYVNALWLSSPNHELTGQARAQLSAEFLARAKQAAATDDTEAAMTWIDEADTLGVDVAAVATARRNLRARLIAIETARRVPASTLTVVDYTPPNYPSRALERELNGWVDVEFTVARDGSTRDISITDASHNSYFRDEATAAIAEWRFEPRVFMDETIEQQAYTRIRFEFE